MWVILRMADKEDEKLYRLFVYGQLKPEYDPPAGYVDIKRDWMQGDLYDLGGDAAAVRIGLDDTQGFVGSLIAVPKAELLRLDKYEMSDYRRIRAYTSSGVACFIYEYDKPVPKTAHRVQSWIWDNPDHEPEAI